MVVEEERGTVYGKEWEGLQGETIHSAVMQWTEWKWNIKYLYIIQIDR